MHDERRALWRGAEVEWVGPARRCGGVPLRRGDRGVVVEPGRWDVGSVAVLAVGGPWSPGRRARRTRRGRITVRFDGGTVRARRDELALVAADHPLRPHADGTVADWWLAALEPWGDAPSVAAFVPRVFPTVTRVLHPFDDLDHGGPAAWDEVVAATPGVDRRSVLTRQVRGATTGERPPWRERFGEPAEGRLPAAVAAALVELLRPRTTTPDDVLVAIWGGWGDAPPASVPGAATVATPHRGHVLLRGPLDGVLTPVGIHPEPGTATSGLWWPADRAWFVVTEVDDVWTYVAGDTALAADLEGRAELETVPTSFDEPATELVDQR